MTSLRNDPELTAIRRIQDILGALPADAQSRVLAYVTQRLTREWAPHPPPMEWPVRRADGEEV